MSQVIVRKIDETEAPAASIFEEIRTLSDRIRERAYEIFHRRGGTHGSDVEDWVNAERDLLVIPNSDLVERDGHFEIKVSAPGFTPDDINVTALPDALIVKAQSTHTHDKDQGNVRFCEFGRKTLFRRFELPESINTDKVTANLERGVLHLTADKALPDNTSNAATEQHPPIAA